MNKNQLQQHDRDHLLHPFTDFHDLGKQGTRVITSAEGPYITDIDGHTMLDGMSGLWCCNLGYSRREISEAIYEQLNKLPFYNSFFQCTTVPSIELADLLSEVTPAGMNNVFFTGSGSEANDTNLRIIRRYWDLKDQPQKRIVISRQNAYHGSTIGGASLGGMSGMHKQFQALDYIEHIQQPYWFGEGGDMSPEEFGIYAARCLDEKIQELGPEKVAAFIAEPIQGAGGVIIPPETYWPEVKKVLDQYDILLVMDEVIFGFGRTGEWFGADYYGMKPDLMTFAKAVTNGYFPLGGTMVSDRVAEVIKAKGGEFTHGYTYSAHPAACMAGIVTVNILRNEKIIENVRDVTGPYLAKRWAELADHPIVGEARTLGLVGALELVKDKGSRARFDDDCTAGAVCRDMSIKNGLVMRATGDTMIIAPPLILDTAHIDELVDKAHRALDETAKAMA
ncbi:aspartate aminotransferase family protein [Microbulbifer agarilyticus]|uniref:aspartate aminotransferase family protein n=1 Tax=Microbulbifer agarilyticus TaxID=260552 RepID=UPI001C96FCCB|nr:aspartate aminotransferase family protein [Microbulbifer agarilyticus]MBY6189710.1 aspartate aminotransferase family protein [Microbulbifer agarilyticus]MBY6211014.1 aspartate aminotransferase family protein [Microbulbifer agarilyticus]MCA0892239.1 aspartate aminotransferase family protein [Microbulbifer agarilyticus]MCA0900728.1 aspartate aminotransferase family protein [Microbulbifer agarilyticus]